ncbi:MAG: ATP-binding protein, partial [Pseudonocardiaceae bacterium]
MAGPDPAVSQVRTAVRRFLAAHAGGPAVAVACSGGADSLALAAATIHCGSRVGLAVHGLVVDHGLQPCSGRVAADAAATMQQLGCTTVSVLPTTVNGKGGPEAAARRARYA